MIEKLDETNLTDVDLVPKCYQLKNVAMLTMDNLNDVINKLNEVIEKLNKTKVK